METQIHTQGEMWRYRTIVREPRIERPVGWFLPYDFVVCQTVKKKWKTGRLLEVNGNPSSLMICMNLTKGLCQAECESHCKHRYWAMADQAGVMGKGDLLRIIADPSLLTAHGSPFIMRDYSQVKHLLRLISNIEKRQKIC